MRFLIALLCMLALAAPAFATDGVLEINQTCAVLTGCFGKDEPGYPVTIDGSAGHSYRLTSDLILPDENTSGIVVSTSDVGIDLNNFPTWGGLASIQVNLTEFLVGSIGRCNIFCFSS